jgi:hypothetical protein
MPLSKNVQQTVTKAMALKEERARDAALAMREYQAERLAVLAKTARLRALRLAQEDRARLSTLRLAHENRPPARAALGAARRCRAK